MSGKLIIVLAALTGLALGGLSVAYHHWLARRALAWWGADDMEIIAHAPRVDALKLARTDQVGGAERMLIGGASYRIQRRSDVTSWPGIDHIRHGLLEDVNFDWDAAALNLDANDWSYALEFTGGSRPLLVIFDRKGHLARSDRSDMLTIARLATGWREFFSEQEQAQESGVGTQRSEKVGSQSKSGETSR